MSHFGYIALSKVDYAIKSVSIRTNIQHSMTFPFSASTLLFGR